MCILCKTNVLNDITFLKCCKKVKIIPHMPNLKKLNCCGTKVTEIPDTLVNLEELICDYTKIRKIPLFPNLTILSCQSMLVEEIPILPKLVLLDCSNTKVKEIPILNELYYLFCRENKLITHIPVLKSLESLNCELSILSFDLALLPNICEGQICSCVKIKNNEKGIFTTLGDRLKCHKKIKQIRLIQRIYRKYQLRRNMKIFKVLQLPYDLFRLIQLY